MRTIVEGPIGAVPAHLAGGAAVLHAEETVWAAMLAGWRAQQTSRNLAEATIERRRSVVCRFQDYVGSYPWAWTAPEVDEFFLEFRVLRHGSHSTLLSYQNALRMFLEYIVDPAYGWVELCWSRFGDHPVQVFHEWNTARHT
ncbi:phage integrase N-terminal SAM-like domain-containing protein [Subtercola vilae]|uniref:phage integrase N-terminal SAM-like domain-containing protein n=1 Tax=Subtercola vilae TaxID=2056433 RepID=UPI001F1DCB83|nr:hypothetical protein [Subtercola vilae]